MLTDTRANRKTFSEQGLHVPDFSLEGLLWERGDPGNGAVGITSWII